MTDSANHAVVLGASVGGPTAAERLGFAVVASEQSPTICHIFAVDPHGQNLCSILSVGFHRVADMSAAHAEPPSADGMVARLDEMLAELADALIDKRPGCDAARIDRIARLEKLRAVTAALQGAESVRFAQSQLAEQHTADVHPSKIGRGIAEQIGLACRISPVTAARRLNTARHCGLSCPTPTAN
jgi:hypothetical protein